MDDPLHFTSTSRFRHSFLLFTNVFHHAFPYDFLFILFKPAVVAGGLIACQGASGYVKEMLSFLTQQRESSPVV